MAYTIIHGDRKEVRRLVGPRPFSEILTHEELLQVERGELVGLNFRGDVLALSSPLENGAKVTLCPPDPERDLAAIGVPANRQGELVGIPEALSIRSYEFDHHVNLWERPLAEIRELLAKPVPAPRRDFFHTGTQPRLPGLERRLSVSNQPHPHKRHLEPLVGMNAA